MTANAPLAVQASKLSRSFGPHTAVAELDLEIESGTAFGLIGENGAGKTTLLRLITGLILPSSGKLEVLGLNPALQPCALRRRLGFVPEEPALFPEMGVRAQLLFFGGAKGLHRKELGDAVDLQIERFDLNHYANRLCGTLSRGLQKRVSLALGFLGDPELILLDEPTSGLDPEHRDSFIAWLSKSRGRFGWILSSHDLREVEDLTSHTAQLSAGFLKCSGLSKQIAQAGISLNNARRLA